MTFKINLPITRWLLVAGLALGAGAAQAVSDVTLTESQVGRFDWKAQETTVKVGMGPTEVLQILGRPNHVVRSRSEMRPIWIYHETGSPFGSMSEFDVDFGSDGKVTGFGTRPLGKAN